MDSSERASESPACSESISELTPALEATEFGKEGTEVLPIYRGIRDLEIKK